MAEIGLDKEVETPECQEAFGQLKGNWVRDKISTIPDHNIFFVTTETLMQGHEAMVTQTGEERKKCASLFIVRKLLCILLITLLECLLCAQHFLYVISHNPRSNSTRLILNSQNGIGPDQIEWTSGDNRYSHTHTHQLNIDLVHFMDEEIEA